MAHRVQEIGQRLLSSRCRLTGSNRQSAACSARPRPSYGGLSRDGQPTTRIGVQRPRSSGPLVAYGVCKLHRVQGGNVTWWQTRGFPAPGSGFGLRRERKYSCGAECSRFSSAAFAQQTDGDDIPRMPWGDPDLQGRWRLGTMTPLERPAGFEGRPRLAGADADAFLETRRTRFRQALDVALSADVEFGDGGASESILDESLFQGRTSLVVSPSTGRMPRTSVGEECATLPSRRMRGIPDGPEDRALDERCLMAGALPLTPGVAFAPVLFQTPDHLVIRHEFINATIIVPLDDRPRLS
jgi:hypothetical protein